MTTLIVGAGPAGLALALALAERGLPVTLVEASRSAHRAVRGEALMPSGLAALEALGLAPLPADVPWRRLSGWSFQIEGRELFSWPEPAAPQAGCTLIDQGALLKAWRQRALALPHLTLLEGVAAVELLQAPRDAGSPSESSSPSLGSGSSDSSISRDPSGASDPSDSRVASDSSVSMDPRGASDPSGVSDSSGSSGPSGSSGASDLSGASSPRGSSEVLGQSAPCPVRGGVSGVGEGVSDPAGDVSDPAGGVSDAAGGVRSADGAHEDQSASVEPTVQGVRLADGRPLRADLVVACDGRGSWLRQRSGLACPTRTDPQEVLWFLLRGASVAPLVAWLAGRFVTVVGPGAAYALFERAAGGVQLGLLQPAGSAQAPAAPADWIGRWAAAAPPALARLLERLEEGTVDGPQRLPVPVGCAERWHRSGLLLLGDAAHPMSPLRAQGLNMALRDAQVAAQRLLPVLRQGDGAGLAAALHDIGALRRREIETIQALQRREARLGELLQQAPALRRLLASTAGWSGPLLARRWAASQQRLRHGVLALTPLELTPLS